MKKGIKRGLASVFVLSSLILGACSSSGSQTDNAEGEEVTLNIMQGKVEFNSQFEELAKKYMDANPNVTINITSVGGGTDYFSQLKTKFASGDEPQIFSVAGPNEIDQFKDDMADLSDMDSVDKALDGTMDTVKMEDKIVGIPYNLEGYGLIYNKEIAEKAGVDFESVRTYDDLKDVIDKIDKQKEKLDIKAAVALPGKETWVMTNHLGNVYLAPEFDNNVLNAYESKTVDFEKSDEYQKMLDLQKDYSVKPVLSLDYSQQVEEYFSLGQVAVIQQGNWIYPTLQQMDEDFAANDVGMISIPVEGYENHLPVGVPNYWAVNGNSDDATVKEAKNFLDWMNLSDEGKDFVLSEFKFVPAYEGYDGSKISDPLSKVVYDYSQSGDTLGFVFNGYPEGWEQDSFGPNIQKYLDGSQTWEETIEKSKEAWASIRQ